MSNASPAPARRELGYDLSRAVALIGMVFINFPGYLADVPAEEGSLLAWLGALHGGRAAALFVTLAGVGVALLSRGARRQDAMRTLLLRSAFLFVLGNALFSVWQIDILHFYAAFLLLAGLVLIWLPRGALLPAAAAVSVATVAIHARWPELSETLDVAYPFAWNYGEGIAYLSPAGWAADVFLVGGHPVLPWIAFLIAGLWIAGHDLSDPATRRSLAFAGVALATAMPVLSYGLEQGVAHAALPDAIMPFLGVDWHPSPLWSIAAIGSSMAVIAFCHMAAARWASTRPVRALIAIGQMALTLYLAHAFAALIPSAMMEAADAPASWPLAWTLVYAALFCLVAGVAAVLYRQRFTRGPVESVMRRLTLGTPTKGAAPELASLPPLPMGLGALALGAVIAVFALQLVGWPPQAGCATPVAAPGTTRAALTLTCLRQDITLHIASPTEVTLATASPRDLYLELYRGDALIGEDDDSGPHTNAKLTLLLPAGDYRIRVRAYEEAVGPFRLIRSDAAPL